MLESNTRVQSVIVVQDSHYPSEGIILTGTPNGNRMVRGATGEVLIDTIVLVEPVRVPESEAK